jgi:MFS family permease
MAGSAAAIFFLSSTFATDVGWRLCFGIGAILGLAIMLVRRSVPESPRWLFIHGREEEAEQIVSSIERSVAEETGQELEEPDESIEVEQRAVIPFREIARTGFVDYPRRAVLGLALFVGQAFIYNGITFNLGTLFSTFFGVSAGFVPVFLIIYAAGNFLGPLLLGRLFDTVGRKPMITITYLGSAIVGAIMAFFFARGTVSSEWWFEGLIVVTFFLASAGASAAYLTVSEIFPMETRALAIAFFYALGTAAGGIAGPLLFAHLIASGSRSEVAIAFYIGSAVMAVGGIAEIFLGVRAEQKSLEEVATPITAEAAEGEGGEATKADHGDEGRAEDDAAAKARRAAADRGRRISERTRRRQAWERTGRRRYRPGPGGSMYAPMMAGTWSAPDAAAGMLEPQIEAIERTLAETGPTERRHLAQLVGARYWGPGRFGLALQEALREGRVRRESRNVIAPVER